MTADAKTQVLCDFCKSNLAADKDKSQQIKAVLNNGQQENQDYDFCSESCLLGFLNARAVRAKKKNSKAAVLEFEIVSSRR